MGKGSRGMSALVLAALTAVGCGGRVEERPAAAAGPAAPKTVAAGALEDRLRGYPESPGSKEALSEFIQQQGRESAEKRLDTVLRHAKEAAGIKLFEAELERRKAAPSEQDALIARVRADAAGTPVATSALAAELDALRQQAPARFLSRCKEILDASSASEGERAVVLFRRAAHFRDAGHGKLGAIDVLRFWAEYPDKVRRMKASASLAAQVREAGYLCEADMLDASDEPEAVALALYKQFAPFADALGGGNAPEKVEPCLAAYVLQAPKLEALEAVGPEGVPSLEKAQFLGRMQRLAAYGGDLSHVVTLSQEYADTLRACVDGSALPDDALALAYAQTTTVAECVRRLLADPHFVRSTDAKSTGAAASMRSEQVLATVSGLSLDLAERRCEKGQIDEVKLGEAYTRHADTLKTINDSDNTIKAYRRFVAAHPRAADAPGFLNRIAEAYRGLGALDSAADVFKEIVEGYPASAEAPAARLNRVVCLYQSEAYEQAYEEGTASCALAPDDPNTANILLLCGLSEAAMGMNEEAGTAMNDIVKRFSESAVAPQALLWLASQALSTQRYDEARRCFQDLVDRYPSSDAAQRAREYLERLDKIAVEPQHGS